MTTENIGLFKALGAKMNYLDQRQRVIAQNIANADTPTYQPKDLLPVDFGAVLKKVSSGPNLRPETTNKMHMPSTEKVADPQNKEQKKVYEEAPVGNAVILEEQMVRSAQNQMDYNLMTNLYQKNVSMIRTALGRQG
ncbi:MAG: flagellar basal body rod protein FlgB [Alphaproteobacteria bacterium]|nr:flagellar basal body rod protein FlgB [Alphaproteobacteria bacterium]